MAEIISLLSSSPAPPSAPPSPEHNVSLKRAYSDMDAAGPSRARKNQTFGFRKPPAANTFDDDPIVFTSSPVIEQVGRANKKPRNFEPTSGGARARKQTVPSTKPTSKSSVLSILDSDSDDLPELPAISPTSRPWSRTASDIADYRTKTSTKASTQRSTVSQSVDKPPTVKRVSKTAEERAAKALEKAAAKAAEAERKRLAREEKARDKQIAADLAKVNTSKTDKKKSTPEMVVMFPPELDVKLRQQAEGFLSKLSVECREWTGAGESLPNCVRWKRKVEAVYNAEQDIWQPVPKRVEEEKHVLVHMLASEFVQLAQGTGEDCLESHVSRLQARFHGYKIIYLIEGLLNWQKKNKNIRNRAFVTAARAESESSVPAAPSGRKKKEADEYVDDDSIEDALLRLQVIHKALIHHTSALIESAEWLSIFTQHISTIPYRRQRMNLDTAFCMESGQVRTGEDAKDTYAKMLCEIGRLTAPVAWGIQAEYATVPLLVKGLRDEGKEAVANVRKSANRDGAFTDRVVGKSLSRKVWNVFMGRDPGSTEV